MNLLAEKLVLKNNLFKRTWSFFEKVEKKFQFLLFENWKFDLLDLFKKLQIPFMNNKKK